ncbi:hypothetical protein D3C72_1259880 [compost metagenome]
MKAFFLDPAKLLYPFLLGAKNKSKPVGVMPSPHTGGKTNITDAILWHIILAICMDQTKKRFFAAGG